MRVTIILALVVPGLFSFSAARGQAAPGMSALHGGVSAVSLREVDVRVGIDGLVARTTLAITVQNDGRSRTEAALVFDVPVGATVSGYSLDVDGTRVDGVAVEREHARSSYEQEVRQRVDPGLVELISGSTFRTRVFPIDSGSTRTFRIGYVSELTVTGGSAVYAAPLNWGETAATFKVHVDVAGKTGKPVMTGELFKDVAFQPADGRFIAEGALDRAALKGNLAIAVESPAAGVAVGQGPAIGAADAMAADGPGYYFAISAPAEVPKAPAAARARPHHIGIFWDAGLHPDPSDLPRKTALLKKILGGCGDVEVDLLFFRETVEKPIAFSIRGGDVSAIEKALAAVTYDGGTRLSNLSFPKHASDLPGGAKKAAPDFDYWLLCSEGASGIGSLNPASAGAPVFALCAGQEARNLLEPLCIAGGGAVLDLARMNDEQALAALQDGKSTVATAEFNPAEVADVTPAFATPVGDRVGIAGRLLVQQANVTLHLRRGEVSRTQTFTIRQADAVKSNTISRVWANHRLAEFAAGPMPNYEQCLHLGRQFNLVTPASSLLVLETAEQYARHDVMPPENMPELRRQYVEIVRTRKAEQQSADQQLQTQVAAAWEQRMDWYETQHTYPADFHYVPPKPNNGYGGMLFGSSGRGGGSLFNSGGGEGGGGGGASGLFSDSASARRNPRNIPDFTDAPDLSLNSASNNTRNSATPAAPAAPQFTTSSQAHVSAGNPDAAVQRAPGGERIAPADPWRRDASYIEAMRRVPRKQAYGVYLQQRADFGTSVAFYLDCGDYLARYCDRAFGARVLTSALALLPDDPMLVRMVARRLDRLGERELAIELYERLLAISYDDPQSYRDLALALADCGDRAAASRNLAEHARALGFYRRAIDLLRTVVSQAWTRSPGIQVVAILECGNILNKARLLDPDIRSPLFLTVGGLLDMDLRITVTWDTDAILHLSVLEPSGETAAGSNGTTIGGMIFDDCSTGFGPEEYCLRRRVAGRYTIRVSTGGPKARFGPTTVTATVITDFGRPTEKRQVFSVIANDSRDTVEIGAVTLSAGAQRP